MEMATILQKIRTLVLSNAHSLLDATIDLNSIGAVEQHVRDLEAATADIRGDEAIARSNVAALEQKLGRLAVEVTRNDGLVDLALKQGKTDHARRLQASVTRLGREKTDTEADLTEAQRILGNFSQMAGRVESRLAEMRRTAIDLARADREADARERAADAIEQAADAVDGDPSVSVDNVAARVRHRAAVADSRLDRAMSRLEGDGGAGTAAADVEVDAALEERKRRLGLSS